jgi:hypothetical protein
MWAGDGGRGWVNIPDIILKLNVGCGAKPAYYDGCGMFCSSEKHLWRISGRLVSWACAMPLLAGCAVNSGSGSNTATTVVPDQAIEITVQPQSQNVPLGGTATFTVAAAIDQPLTYVWSKDWVTIPGATGPSYTTPPVTFGPNGSTTEGTYQVSVSDAITGVVSESATLQIGPRLPKAGDLRYLLMEQVAPSDLGQQYVSGGSAIFGDALGDPLSMGSSVQCVDGVDEWNCAWSLQGYFLSSPSYFSMHYQPGGYSYFALDMQSIIAPNVILTSLDLEAAADVYGVSWVQTTQPGGFDYRLDPLIPAGADQQAQIQAQVVLDGTESRIVTAVSFDVSGSAYLISYGWQGDTTTVYEAQTTFVPPGSNVVNAVAAATTTLANEGYFISAFGGNDTDGYLLVGMRVLGDTYPRPVKIETFLLGTTTTIPATNPDAANYTYEVYLQEFGNDVFVGEQ